MIDITRDHVKAIGTAAFRSPLVDDRYHIVAISLGNHHIARPYSGSEISARGGADGICFIRDVDLSGELRCHIAVIILCRNGNRKRLTRRLSRDGFQHKMMQICRDNVEAIGLPAFT